MGRPSDGLPRRATLTHSARPCQYSTAKKRGLNGGEERIDSHPSCRIPPGPRDCCHHRRDSFVRALLFISLLHAVSYWRGHRPRKDIFAECISAWKGIVELGTSSDPKVIILSWLVRRCIMPDASSEGMMHLLTSHFFFYQDCIVQAMSEDASCQDSPQ